MRQAVEAVITVLRPAIRADGGDLRLVGVDESTGVVQVELTGSCSGCSGTPGTNADGIKAILADRVAGISAVEQVGGCAGTPSDACGTPVTL